MFLRMKVVPGIRNKTLQAVIGGCPGKKPVAERDGQMCAGQIFSPLIRAAAMSGSVLK